MENKENIRHYSLTQLRTLFESRGEPAFRSKQLYEWIWSKSARSFDDMTNLSKSLRQRLKETYDLNFAVIDDEQISSDGTVKFAFRLFDDHIIEGVLIPSRSRMTACISSQVGCSLSCRFCATGQLDLRRNVNFDEIYDQVTLINERAHSLYQLPLTNIVYMGMGEPLLNYRNVLRSIQLITGNAGLGMSPKRITVSTVGIAKMIRKLADEETRVNFALSLHSAIEDKRNAIMPITGSNSLDDLRDAIQYFYHKTGTRITYEYTLLKGFNDGPEDASALAEFCKISPCKINLIEYNPVESLSYEASTGNATHKFREFLDSKNIVVNIRRSRGKDIDAACGQLANNNEAAETLS